MTQGTLERLRGALHVLALPPDMQIQHVRDLHVDLDEIALEFDDIAPVRVALVESGEMSPAQALAVDEVDRQLLEMSEAGPGRWTDEAATEGEDWKELRRLAGRALQALA